jgi:hypothetical protein
MNIQDRMDWLFFVLLAGLAVPVEGKWPGEGDYVINPVQDYGIGLLRDSA